MLTCQNVTMALFADRLQNLGPGFEWPVLDATAGLWCANAGHCRQPIVEAIQKQAAELDFAPTFQFGHPKVFELASRLSTASRPSSWLFAVRRLCEVMAMTVDSVFFTR